MQIMKRISSYEDLILEKERLNQKVKFDLVLIENKLIHLKYDLFSNALKLVYDFITSKKK